MPVTTETKEIIFSRLKQVLEDHCPPLVEKQNKKDNYEVIGNTPAPYGSKKEIIPGMFFATAVIRKDNVSFYFFCNYMHPQEFHKLAPTVMKISTVNPAFISEKKSRPLKKN